MAPVRRDDEQYSQFIDQLKQRTKSLALRVIRLFSALPRNEAARIIGRQLVRSATSVGANYRASCRVRTGKEFAAKIRIVCEEADETQYWIELLIESELVPASKLQALHAESGELVAIFSKALQTARNKIKNK